MFTAIKTFSRGQSQPQPQPPQPQPQLPTHAQAQKVISDQVRQEWHDFESAWFKPQQSGMERRCAEKFKEMDKVFRASTAANNPPVASSSSKSKKRSTNNNTNTVNNSAAAKAAAKEHESKKVQVREELRKELVLKAREEWQRRLTGKGLRDDDWADMSVDEQEAVERALGGDFEEDDEDDSEQEMTFSQMQAPMMSTAAVGTSLFPSLSSLPSQPAASSLAAVAGPSSSSRTTLPSLQTLQTNVAPAPSLSSATRSTNASTASTSTASSSYAFVNPSSLGKPARPTQPEDDDDDDDETSPFEDIGFVYDAMKRKSDYRDAYDTPTGSSSFSGTNSGWSTDLSLSTHTSHTSSPEQPAPRTIPPMDKDSSMPGSWFASAGPSQKDVNATPTTATAKSTKSGWGAASAGPSKLNGKAGAPAHPSTSTTTTTTTTTSSSSSASTRPRSSGHYVGPDLNTTDDFPFTSSSSSASASTSHNTDNSTLLTSNSTFSSQSQSSSSSEEADFENYKMDVRIAKIREFHEEAAAADENLIREIFRARKLWKLGLYDEEIDMGGDEGRDIERGSTEYTDILRKRREKKCWEVECRRIEEHERTMVNLRKLKEDERRGIVEMERRKRREAIRGQQQQQQQQQQQRGSVVGQQQQRREREAREREAKEEAAREREREIMMKETEMRERAIALMGSKAPSSHGSLFAPPTQISLEHSASSFASAFNNTSVPTSLFTPTPATSTTNPFNASFHQPSQSSSHPTNTTTKATTISLFPEEEEFAIDEAKIASMLASQMQMAQKFDGWSSGSGGSKGGSPRSLGEGGTPLPATTTGSGMGNETKGTGSSSLSAKVEPSSTTKAAPSADNSKKGEAEKVKEEKGPGKKGPSTSTPAGKAAPAIAPAIAVTSSSESEPKSEPVKVVPATGKNAKKKGKKGQAAVPVPAPAPAPTPVKEKEVAKAPAKVEPAKTPAKVEAATTAKGKIASPPAKEVPSVPAKSGKVETKTPAKKDDTPTSTTSSSATSNVASSGPTAKVSSIWGKKEEPVVAKGKKEETTSTPQTSISQPAKTAPTPTRWKVSLFDDEPTPAPVPVPSKSTMDSMTSSSTSSSFAAKHGLQPPSAQSFWHPPGTNSGVARSTSDQPGGGLKAPEPSSVARAASDQPVNKMSSSSSMAAQKSVPERWLPPQAKQQQQPQPSVAQPQPQPWDRKPTNASFARTRRMSEPAPPSPVDPAFFAEASKATNGRSAEVQGILKNTPATKASASGRGKAGRKATVVVEDASDDEEDQDGIVGEALAVDSRYIMEENPGIVRPKPSVAGKMFNNIFDYEEDDSGSSTTEVPVSFAAGGEGLMKGAGEGGMSWDALAKSGKAKHVRWTPSTLGNASPISFGGDEETASVNIENFLQTATSTLASAGMPTQAPPQGRGRTSSVSHASGGFKGWGQTVPASAFGGGGGAVAERGDMNVMGLGKGKGVDRGSFSKQDASDEMGWYTKGAMESLKQMRSKPASAV